MPLCALPDQTVIDITGPDAEHFLHNLVTTNIVTLPQAVVSACALLSPQGKVLFDFLISKHDGDVYRLDIRRALCADFVKRLTLYKLRADVKITVQDQIVVGASWGSDSIGSDFDSYADRRFGNGGVYRLYGTGQLPDAAAGYAALRVAHGVVESGMDYAPGDVFAHDISLDQNGGVDFRKGCYVGQEVVSRMHHRKTARRRIVMVNGSALQSELGLLADGKPAGTIGTVSGTSALAIARLDRLKQAMNDGSPLTVNGAVVSVSLPPDVSYDWPLDIADDA